MLVLDAVTCLMWTQHACRADSQCAYGYRQPINASHDVMMTKVAIDYAVLGMIAVGSNFPDIFPNYCSYSI